MWQELKSIDLGSLAKYSDVGLKFFASDEHYEEASNLYLARQLVNKSDKLLFFLYEDGKKQMIYGLKYSDSYPNPYTKEKGMWKVVDLAYLGEWGEIDKNGVSQEALKFGLKSVRDKLDELGIKNWYVIFNMDTRRIDRLPPDLAPQARIFLQFLNDVQRECTEITETIPLTDGTHFVCHFRKEK